MAPRCSHRFAGFDLGVGRGVGHLSRAIPGDKHGGQVLVLPPTGRHAILSALEKDLSAFGVAIGEHRIARLIVNVNGEECPGPATGVGAKPQTVQQVD